MRKILFKAKRVDNGEWVEGDYITFDPWKAQDGHFIFDDEAFAFEIDPETLCQLTGLQDKDGKDIWEGDICEISFATGIENCEIVEEKGCYWVSQRRTNYIRDMAFDNLFWHLEGCKVIGNCHDNPDLLTDGKKEG